MIDAEQELAHGRPAERTLVFRTRELSCALPLASVEEIMRPLPVKPLEGMPPFVMGIAVIRGAPVPVVDTGSLLGRQGSSPTRFIALKVADRRVALAVDEVLGIRALPAETLGELPPLLRDAQRGAIELIGRLDAEFILVLRGGWLVPDSVWTYVEAQEMSQ